MKSINQIRRERLRELVRRFDAGKTSRFTERMGWKSPSLANRYLSSSPRNNKPIGDNLAREIESAYGVEENFLDSVPADAAQVGPIEARLVVMFRELSPDGRRNVLGYVQEALLREAQDRVPPFGPTVFEEDVRERSETIGPKPSKARRSS